MGDEREGASLDEAFEEWVEAFRGPLVGLLASWSSDWGLAEELAQDTFAEAWLGRSRFRGDPRDLEAVGAWLRGIAFHLNAAALRRRTRTRGEPFDERQAAAGTDDASRAEERRALLAAAFGLLSAPHQAILRMHYLEETGTREVAALLGLTPKAVESRLYQARKALRTKIDHVARGNAREVRT